MERWSALLRGVVEGAILTYGGKSSAVLSGLFVTREE